MNAEPIKTNWDVQEEKKAMRRMIRRQLRTGNPADLRALDNLENDVVQRYLAGYEVGAISWPDCLLHIIFDLEKSEAGDSAKSQG